MGKIMKELAMIEESLLRPTAFHLSPEDYNNPEKIRESQFLEYHFNELIAMLDKYDRLKEKRKVSVRPTQRKWVPPILRKWPYLALLHLHNHPRLKFDEYYAIRKNVLEGKEGNTEINFINKYQRWEGNTQILNSIIVYMRPLGNASGHWYYISKNDRIDAIIIAGYDNETPKAYLALDWYDRSEHLIELESLYVLSVTEKTNDSEISVMTLYNRNDSVQTKVIEGFPSLLHATKFSLRSYPTPAGGGENTEPDHTKTTTTDNNDTPAVPEEKKE